MSDTPNEIKQPRKKYSNATTAIEIKMKTEK